MRASQIGKKISVVSQFEHDTDRMRVEEFVLWDELLTAPISKATQIPTMNLPAKHYKESV